jgi:hypothetical protein
MAMGAVFHPRMTNRHPREAGTHRSCQCGKNRSITAYGSIRLSTPRMLKDHPGDDPT